MTRPDFTPEEEYVIAYHRDKSHMSPLNAVGTEIACIIATVACVAFGLYKGEIAWVCAGLAPMVYLHLVSAIRIRKYMKTYHSIFTKYETTFSKKHSAARENTEQADAADNEAGADD